MGGAGPRVCRPGARRHARVSAASDGEGAPPQGESERAAAHAVAGAESATTAYGLRGRSSDQYRVAARQVRHTERGYLADFAVVPVWTITKDGAVRAEWLVIRRDPDGRVTYSLLSGAADTPAQRLIERSCWRFFTERTFQDAKSEMGWDDFQARKYRAWEHAMALTAAATWFVAGVKFKWRGEFPRDPALAQELTRGVARALDGQRPGSADGRAAAPRDEPRARPGVGSYTFGEPRLLVEQSLEHSAKTPRFILM